MTTCESTCARAAARDETKWKIVPVAETLSRADNPQFKIPKATASVMKESLLQYLACPACGGDLALTATDREDAEIISGELRCGGWRPTFSITCCIPRFSD